jgi:hypothetical protein
MNSPFPRFMQSAMLLLTCITLLNFSKMSARAESTVKALERTISHDPPVEIQKHSRQQRYLANQSLSSTNTSHPGTFSIRIRSTEQATTSKLEQMSASSTTGVISNQSSTLHSSQSSISNATDMCKVSEDSLTAAMMIVSYNIALSFALSPVGFIALFLVDCYRHGCKCSEKNYQVASDNEMAPANVYPPQATPYQPPQALYLPPAHAGPSYPQYPAPAAGYPAPVGAYPFPAAAAAYPPQYAAPGTPAGGYGGGYPAPTYYGVQYGPPPPFAQPTASGWGSYMVPTTNGGSSHYEVPQQLTMTVPSSEEQGAMGKNKERELEKIWPTGISEYYKSAVNLLYQIGYRGVFVFIQIRSGNFINPALFVIDLTMAAYFGFHKQYCPGCLYNDIHVLLHKKKFKNVSISCPSHCKFIFISLQIHIHSSCLLCHTAADPWC